MNSVTFSLIGPIDWIIFSFVLLATYWAMFYGAKLKNSNNKAPKIVEHILMGRRLTLPMFVGTLVATWYGGIFGVTEIAYKQGIYNLITQGFFWYLTYIVFALFLVKKIRATEALTLPSMVGKIFGKKSAIVAALFNLINVLPITYILSLGFLLQTLFGGPLEYYVCLSAILGLSISLWGGFSSIVFSDLVQFFVMVISVILVMIFSLVKIGSPSLLVDALPKHYFSFTGGESLLSTLAWGLIALATLVNPSFYQRVFAAKDDKTAKNGILISTLIWLLFDLCTTFGAIYARYALPNAVPHEAYLRYALALLPMGLRGLLLAGVLATILTTLDSYLFIAGNTLSFDLLPKKYWRRKTALAHFIATAVCALTATLLAFAFEGNIKFIWKTLGSYFSASLLLPVLFGQIFPGRITDNQFVMTTLSSAFVITIYRFTSLKDVLKVDVLYVGIITTLILILVSLLKNYFLKKKLT